MYRVRPHECFIPGKNRRNTRLCPVAMHLRMGYDPKKGGHGVALYNITSYRYIFICTTINTYHNKTDDAWYTEYATDVHNLLFLARLEFSCKTGCVPHYFQYKEVTFLFLPQNIRLKFFIVRFFTSVAYCKPDSQYDLRFNRML